MFMDVQPDQLHILTYPHEALRTKARSVENISDEVCSVAERMIELMREAEGIGLAAPQVGLSWRLFVAEIPEGEDRSASHAPPTATSGPQVYVNPRIVAFEGDLEPHDEGCLSLPDVSGEVRRPPIVTMRASTLEGTIVEIRGGGLLARCWQHEIDHLDGVLIIDKMTPRSRMKNRSIVRDLEKHATPAR
jgi:peptide deformylase